MISSLSYNVLILQCGSLPFSINKYLRSVIFSWSFALFCSPRHCLQPGGCHGGGGGWGGGDEDVQLHQDNLDFNELMTIKMLMEMKRTKKITTNSRRGDVVASLTISLLIQVTTDHPGQ